VTGSNWLDGTGPWFVTRSGSFGDEDALAALLDAVFAGSEGCPPTRPT